MQSVYGLYTYIHTTCIHHYHVNLYYYDVMQSVYGLYNYKLFNLLVMHQKYQFTPGVFYSQFPALMQVTCHVSNLK